MKFTIDRRILRVIILSLVTYLFNLQIVSAQLGEVEGDFRVSDAIPTIQLYDNVQSENRIESIWREANDDIYFYSLYGALYLGAETDGSQSLPKHLNIRNVADNGRIGINETLPDYPLQIRRSAGDDETIGINGNAIFFLDDEPGSKWISSSISSAALTIRVDKTPANSTTSVFNITTRKENSAVHRPISIIGNGDVGIGESFFGFTPSSSIHLRHRFSNTDPRHDGVKIENAGANGHYFTMYVVNASNDLELYTGQSANPVGRFDAVTGIYSALSDARLKEDVEPIENALDKISALNPVTYHFKHDSIRNNRSAGLLAQELQTVLPHLVEKSESVDVNLVDYTSIIPYLIKAIQEQNDLVNSMEQRMTTIQEVNRKQEAYIENLEEKIRGLN